MLSHRGRKLQLQARARGKSTVDPNATAAGKMSFRNTISSSPYPFLQADVHQPSVWDLYRCGMPCLSGTEAGVGATRGRSICRRWGVFLAKACRAVLPVEGQVCPLLLAQRRNKTIPKRNGDSSGLVGDAAGCYSPWAVWLADIFNFDPPAGRATGAGGGRLRELVVRMGDCVQEEGREGAYKVLVISSRPVSSVFSVLWISRVSSVAAGSSLWIPSHILLILDDKASQLLSS